TPSHYDCWSFPFSVGNRQREIEFRTVTVNVFRRDLTTMGFDDGADNRQAHSESLIFGREKLFEESLAGFFWNADAMIAHAHLNRALPDARGRYFHSALFRRRFGHRIKCVADEIDQDLLNLDGIAFDLRERLGQRSFDLA